MAANNAATAFQNARLINELRTAQKALRDQEQELRKAHDELGIKVAERTSELRRSERELRDVIDAIPTIAWSALPDGSNTYVNKGFAKYSGLSAEQAAESGWQAATHPDDLQQHLSKWMESVATGEPFENELRFRRADGEYRWHLCRGVPLRDEGRIIRWYGILFDIDELKKTESALQEREHELLGIIDTIPSMIWSTSPTGEVTHLSKRVFEYSGLRFEDFLDLGWKRFIHPDDYESTAKAFFHAIQTGSHTIYSTVCGVRMENTTGITPGASLYVAFTTRLSSGTGLRLTSMRQSGQKITFAIRALSRQLNQMKGESDSNAGREGVGGSYSSTLLYFL